MFDSRVETPPDDVNLAAGWRITPSMARVAVALALLGLALPLTATGASRYSDPSHGWTVDLSRGLRGVPWIATTVPPNQTVTGSIVSNFRARRTVRRGFTRFPATGVALVIWTSSGGPPPPPTARPPRDTRLPISLRSFKPAPWLRGPNEPLPRSRGIVAAGTHFEAAVWFGSRSTPASRAAIAQAVSSLRFR
jgi:hypothetical protein